MPKTIRQITLVAVLAAASSLTPAQTRNVDCYVSCAPVAGNATAKCKLSDSPQLDTASYKMIRNCPERKVEVGSVLLRYRHAGQWINQVALSDSKLNEVFVKFPADECSVTTPPCIQIKMRDKKAPIGGHGIDGQPSTPGGTGDPCAVGLPCGRVLPPPPQWRFQLEDARLNGQWVVQITRGTPPAGAPKEFNAAVNAGIVVSDGALLVPGATYGYRLLDSSGAVRATGEFSLLSRPLVQTLRGLAAKRVEAGQTEAMAWVDALAANELDWDAYQLSVEAR